MRRALLLFSFLTACGGDAAMDDGGPDANNNDAGVSDASGMDSSKMDASKDSSVNDASDAMTSDATISDASDAMTSDVADATIVDVVDGGGPDASDGGMFDPKTLSGLVLWLEASQGITKNNNNQVSKWADQSGKGNDATANNNQPTWNSSVINARPAVKFGGGTFVQIADAQSLQFGTGDFLIEIVARFSNSSQTFGMFYGKVGMSNGIVLFANDPINSGAGIAAGIDSNNFVTKSANYNDNTARSYGFARAGSTLDLRVQAASASSQQQSGNVDVSASGNAVFLGDYQSSTPLSGDIAEVIAVKGSTSSQDLQALEAYFKSKYNL